MPDTSRIQNQQAELFSEIAYEQLHDEGKRQYHQRAL